MEHTANIINPKQGIITSLLKVFAMFELHLIDDGEKETTELYYLLWLASTSRYHNDQFLFYQKV